MIVGTATSDKGTEAFRWTAADGMMPLGDLPDGEFSSSAYAVSGDGKVVVGRAAGPVDPRHFCGRPNKACSHSIRSCATSRAAQWQLTEARDISDDATVVVGIGINPEKETAAWLMPASRRP